MVYLNPKIRIRSDFQLVVLPDCLRDYELEMLIDHLDLSKPIKGEIIEYEPHNQSIKPEKIYKGLK